MKLSCIFESVLIFFICLCLNPSYFIFLLFLLRSQSSDRFSCHLPKLGSRGFLRPHSLRVQASRFPAEPSSTGPSFLPHEGQGLSPCPCMVTTVPAPDLWAPLPPSTSPRSFFCISSLIPLHFRSLDFKKTHSIFYIFRAVVVPAPHFQMSTTSTCIHRGHTKTKIFSIVKSPVTGYSSSGKQLSPSSKGKSPGSPWCWVPAKFAPCGWLLSTVTEGLLCARYWVLDIHSISFNPPSSTMKEVLLLSPIQLRKLPNAQIAKKQNQDSALVWLSLYQIPLVSLHPSTSYLHLSLLVQSSGDGVHVVSFLFSVLGTQV